MTEGSAPRKTAAVRTAVVRGSAAGFAQSILAGRHTLASDEPTADGGTDSGPTPYELLLSALGACTSMTLGLYARRKGWPLEKVTVTLRHSKVHAIDCADCDRKEVLLDHIERDIELEGPLTDEQQRRLLEMADKCPIHKTLTSKAHIETRLIGTAQPPQP